ncbi:hypothetical protein COO60DRAFT_909108 [Scenedesmus sp. NREL 46B-D3]|nr:hypothetical protein COO60DRAFT_909108 [Scenedesmus sp. NREL 46B-D3]
MGMVVVVGVASRVLFPQAAVPSLEGEGERVGCEPVVQSSSVGVGRALRPCAWNAGRAAVPAVHAAGARSWQLTDKDSKTLGTGAFRLGLSKKICCWRGSCTAAAAVCGPGLLSWWQLCWWLVAAVLVAGGCYLGFCCLATVTDRCLGMKVCWRAQGRV